MIMVVVINNMVNVYGEGKRRASVREDRERGAIDVSSTHNGSVR